MDPFKILVSEPLDFSPRAIEILRGAGEVELRQCGLKEIVDALTTHDAVWLRLAHRLDADALSRATRCRFLAVPATGTDHIDHQACQEQGIEIVSLRGETEFLKTVRATAELTLAVTLALVRKIPAAAQDVLAGNWNRDAFRGRELYGHTVGLVGMGRLGTIVAGYFRVLGMEVLGYDPRPDFPHDVARRVNSLPELLAQSDIVSLHVAFSEATRHLIGRRELEAMKPGAVLVNTSRGGVIDETALADALVSGRLAGAALDVLDGEPHITGEHPLVALARNCDRLLIVPHIGGNTFESFERTEVFLAEKLTRKVAALQPRTAAC